MTREQSKSVEEYRKKFEHIINYNVSNPNQMVVEEKTERKMEIISESAIPQPVAEELYNYFALDGSWCKIENRILVDEQESYKHYGHPLWVYVEFPEIKSENPHAYYSCFYLPITVEKNPRVIGNISHLNIDSGKINKIKRFISGNVKWFKDIADQKIHRSKHKNKLKPIFLLKENVDMLLLEMANILKRKSGLDVNIWADTGRNLQHSDRIKFQNDYGEKINMNNSCTMMLHPPMNIVGKTILDSKKIQKIRTFCTVNKENIISFFNQEINEDEFDERMIAIDNKTGKPIYKTKPDNSEWEEIPKMRRLGISVVKSNSGKYNYSKNGILLTNCWFDVVNPFQQFSDNTLVAYAQLNDVWYQVAEDGTISKFN